MSLVSITRADGLQTDPPRRDKRLLLQVTSDVGNHIIAGVRVMRGKNLVVVYSRDLKAFENEVEPLGEAAFEAAKKQMEQEFEDWLIEKTQGTTPTEGHNWDTCPFSIPATFRKQHGRGPKPLRDIEMLEELPPPKREDLIDGLPAIGYGETAEMIADAAGVNIEGDPETGWTVGKKPASRSKAAG